MANGQRNQTQQVTGTPLDPSLDPDLISQISGAETPGGMGMPSLVPRSFTEWAGDEINTQKIAERVPPGTPLPSVVAKAIKSGAPNPAPTLFNANPLDAHASTLEDALMNTPTPSLTDSTGRTIGQPPTGAGGYQPAPTPSQPGQGGPPQPLSYADIRKQILATNPAVIPAAPYVPHGGKLALTGLFAAADNIGAYLDHGTPTVGPGLMKNVQALQEYNRTLPVTRQQAENAAIDEGLRQQDTASQVNQRNAQTYQITHPNKPNAAEPLFDKAGGLIGFRDAAGNMLSPNSPNLTQDMKEIYQLAQDKPIKALTPEAQTFDSLVKSGKSQMEAFQAIEAAKQSGKEGGPAEDARYEKIIAAQKLGQQVPREDSAWASAYEKRKTLAPVAQATLSQPNKDNDRLDRSYTHNDNKLDKLASPIEEKQQRLSTLLGNVNLNSAAADSVIAPELLTVMAGGQGSGVRMTDSEIRRITSGRSSMQDMKALLQKVAGGGQSFTDSQRGEIRAMVDLVQSKIQRKLQIIGTARDQMLDATSVEGHRQVISKAQRDLDGIDAGDIAQQQSGAAPAGGTSLAGPIKPGEPTAGGGKVVFRSGKWVDPTTGNEVK